MLPRAEVPPCLPATNCSSPLAASRSGQGHLKIVAGQTITSLPCRELPSLGALVPMASLLSPPSHRAGATGHGGSVVQEDLG